MGKVERFLLLCAVILATVVLGIGSLLGFGERQSSLASPGVSVPPIPAPQSSETVQSFEPRAREVVPVVSSTDEIETLKAQLASLRDENQALREHLEELSRELESYRLERHKTLVEQFLVSPVSRDLTEEQKEYITGFVTPMLGELPSDAEILLLAETAGWSSQLTDWNTRWTEKNRSLDGTDAETEALLEEKDDILREWKQAVRDILGEERTAKLFPE